MNGSILIRKQIFYSASAGYYNGYIESEKVGTILTFRTWESNDSHGVKFGGIYTQHFGWKEDIENGIIGFPIEKAQSCDDGFHFPGCRKGEIPYLFLKKRYEILKNPKIQNLIG